MIQKYVGIYIKLTGSVQTTDNPSTSWYIYYILVLNNHSNDYLEKQKNCDLVY